jgi:hypothetical protein
MKRCCFPENVYKATDQGIVFEKTTRIIYKCDCGYELLWMDEWTDEKKAEVKAEVDAHHNYHIIPDETNPTE